jgi:preprotein translocase subunit SecD
MKKSKLDIVLWCGVFAFAICTVIFGILFGVANNDRNIKLNELSNYQIEQIETIQSTHNENLIFSKTLGGTYDAQIAEIDGDDIANIYATNQNDKCIIYILFNDVGWIKFNTLVSEIGMGSKTYIYLTDGIKYDCISAPQITQLDMSNPVFISGEYTPNEAKQFVDKLSSGSLPTKINQLNDTIAEQKNDLHYPTAHLVFLIVSCVGFVGLATVIVCRYLSRRPFVAE